MMERHKNWPKDATFNSPPLGTETRPRHHYISSRQPTRPAPVGSSKSRPSRPPASRLSGRYGLFATRRLKPGSLILPYLGLVHWEDDSSAGSDYDLSLDREAGLALDAARAGNEARFINDYQSHEREAEFRV